MNPHQTSLPFRHRRLADDNMIPLINIVFLLLIFFMIAGQIRNASPALELPSGEQGQEPANTAMRLAVMPDGSLELNGETTDEAALLETLSASKPAITLFVDHRLQASDLDTVLGTLRRAGVASVTLLTKRVPQP